MVVMRLDLRVAASAIKATRNDASFIWVRSTPEKPDQVKTAFNRNANLAEIAHDT
jgi:hypothetical protein